MEHKQLNIKAPGKFETTVGCSCGWQQTVFGRLNKKTKDQYHQMHVAYTKEASQEGQ